MRPKIICYMMTSVDGRIDCEMTAQLPGVEDYYPLLDELQFDATVSGRTTAELELAEPGKFEDSIHPVNQEMVSCKNTEKKQYEVVVDTRGTLLWKNDSEYQKHTLIITSQKVSREYLEYLDGKNISYVVTGTDHIDLQHAMEILHDIFHVEKVGVVGGPAINTAFLDEGLLDEVILLIGAGIDGRQMFPPVFNRNEDTGSRPTKLKLKEVKPYDSGAVLIAYETVKEIER